MTAGPSFELFYENDYLMPHREAAWALLAERLDEAGWLCLGASGRPGTSASPGRLDPVLARPAGDVPVTGRRAARGQRARPARDAPGRARLPDSSTSCCGRARELADRVAAEGEPGELSGLFGDGLRDRHVRRVRRGLLPGRPAGADRAPAGRQRAAAAGGRAEQRRDAAHRRGGNGAGRGRAESAGRGSGQGVGRGQDSDRAARPDGQAGDCPPGLAEAVAALQDLAGRLAAAGRGRGAPRRAVAAAGRAAAGSCRSRATARTW